MPISRVSLIPGRSYLVVTEIVGTVMDVAFFNGVRSGGGLWWTMGNIDFPSSTVAYWAYISEPVK